jgi:hypothetical protein
VIRAGGAQAADGNPPLYLEVKGFAERYAGIEPDVAARKLNITLKRMEGNAWRLTAVLDVGASETVKLVSYASLSDQRLGEIVEDARKAWDGIVTDERLYDLARRPAFLADALARMAEVGRDTWNALFAGGGGVGQSLNAIGRMLEDNPPAPGAPIQIVCLEPSVDFVFPWTLLYLKPYAKGEVPDPENFWGYRYAIEMRNLLLLGDRPRRRPSKIAYAVWRKFGPLSVRQGTMLAALVATRPDDIFVSEPPIEGGELFVTTLDADDLDLLYVFAHGYTRARGLGSLAVLKDWLAKKLAGSSATALDDELSALRDNLEEIGRTNADDWIKLTQSTLTYKQLLKSRGRLNRRPIVFLNMCHSAQVNPGLAEGFVSYFLQRGACAVVGTECPIPAFFADTFAEQVFKELAKGGSLGKAVYEARKTCSIGNPLALAYSLYGYADARITEPVVGVPTPIH